MFHITVYHRCFVPSTEVEVMSSMWICPEALLGSTSRRPSWCIDDSVMPKPHEHIMDYVGMQGFPRHWNLWYVLLSIWDNRADSWWLVCQYPPFLFVCTSTILWNMTENFSGRLLRYWSGNGGCFFEQLPGFLGGLIWRHTHLVAWFYTIWWCTIPKIHLENSPLTISIWKTTISLFEKQWKNMIPFSTVCFPNEQIRSTVQLQATNTRLNVVLATGADLTRRGALIAVRTVGRVMDSIWILFKAIEMISKFGKLNQFWRMVTLQVYIDSSSTVRFMFYCMVWLHQIKISKWLVVVMALMFHDFWMISSRFIWVKRSSVVSV